MAARKAQTDSGGAASAYAEVAVADEYSKCRSFLIGGVEVLITDGKVTVSNETAKYLKEHGYLK